MAESELNCPLCQQPNLCGVDSVEPCWCMTKTVPKALISQIPNEQRNKSCICEKCVDKYNRLSKAL